MTRVSSHGLNVPLDGQAQTSETALSLQVRALSRLHELAMHLAETSEPQPALQAILETLVEVHSADFGWLSIYNATSDCLTPSASVGFNPEQLSSLTRLGIGPDGGACPSASAWKARIVIENVDEDPRSVDLRELARAAGFRAVHSTPILTRSGDAVGVLSVQFKSCRRPIECELQLADLCARHAADALEIARSRQSLRVSEERLRLATQAGRIGIWDWDIVGNRVSWTESLYAIHGVKRDEFDGTVEGFAALVHPQDRDMARRAIQRALHEDAPYELEFRAIRPNGEVIWLFTNAAVYREAERPVRMIGATLDVTSYKRAQLAAHDSQERFAQFMKHLPGLAWIKDVAGCYVFANEAAHQAFQTTPDRLYGKTDADVFSQETAAGFQENDRRALEGACGLQTIETLKQPDGILHHSLVNKFPIPGPDGAPAWIGGMAIDITEHKQMEDSLRASEGRFRALADHAPVGIFQSGPNGETVVVNHCWCEMAGLTADQAAGYGWIQAIHPDDRERVVAGWTEAVRSAVGSSADFRFLRPDGVVTWLQGNALPLHDPQGKLLGYIGTVVDITQRKKNETALRESEQRFRNMADHAPVMIWVTDEDGRCTFLGKTWYDFTGRKPSESLGFGWAEAIHPDDRAEARKLYLAADARHVPYRLEYRLRNHDGSYHWVIDAAVPRFGDDGRFLGYIGSVIDISDRKAIEEALRVSEQLYRAIGESIDYGVWVCEPDGRTVYSSDSFLRLVGLTPEECSNFGWCDALQSDDAERTITAWKECVQSGGTWDVEHRFRGVDGKWHPVLSRGVPVRNERGEITAWAGINLDISRLKEVENSLREADRRKDEFLAVLAHELRNPLAPIRAGLELMRPAGDDRAVVEQVRLTMDRQSQQMVRLIDDLLDVSRITRGTLELRTCRVELAAVIDSAVETARPIIAALEHKLEVVLPERPVVLEADVTRLAQVISNLLNNAAKYMPRGGTIRLTAQRSADSVIVSVRDFGIGIMPEMIDRIFDMFTQADSSLERSQGGLGIGLTLAKRLVELHGGTMSVHSDGINQGSEFTVRLPAVAGMLGAPPDSSRQSTAVSRKRRVLVVDDNQHAADLLSMLLKALGSDVRTAYDGFAAIELAKEFRPEILLLDIGMPKLNGYDTARRIRAQPWGRDIVLAALTGWGQEEDKRRTREAGFDHHFVKPVDPAVLQQLLTQYQPVDH